jgi:DnaK suppressor protein
MNPKTRDALARQLRQQRDRLWEEATAADSELSYLAEGRESEIEEVAQQERASRLMAALDLRAKHEIEEIDAALARIADGRYGVCTQCGADITVTRLRAVPATRFCRRCASAGEAPAPAEEAAPVRHPGALPADRGDLTDRELESELRELVSADGRVDTEELRIVCRHGIVHLDGALPSEAEHDIVRKLLTDVVGMREIVDRVRIQEILWERPDRAEPETKERAGGEADVTEDVVTSSEEGIEYIPPDDVPPEPEK